MSQGEPSQMSENGQDSSENFAPRLDSLMGDTARNILAMLRRMPAAWVKLPEMDQTLAIELVKAQSTLMVRNIFELIAADHRVAFQTTLKDFKVDPKNILHLAIAVDAADLEESTVQELLATKLHGQPCVMTFGIRQYLAEGEPVAATPDQANLPLADPLPDGATVDAETGEVTEAQPNTMHKKNPFAEGYTMGRSGGPEHANPYPSNSIDRQEWIGGYEKGHEEALATMHEKLKGQTEALADRRRRGPRFLSPSSYRSPGREP